MGLLSRAAAKPAGPAAAAAAARASEAELAHTVSAPADPERPAVTTAASAPAGTLDGTTTPAAADAAGSGKKKKQLLVGRAKSDPTGDHSLKPLRDTMTAEEERTLQHVQLLSKVLDQALTIPVIKKKIGLDALIGLVPYAGDMVGGAAGTYIITRALKFRMPKRLVARMIINQGIDSVVGIVPFVGDIFDIGFKANTRNMKLLQEHLEHPRSATRADTCFLCGLFFLVVVLPMILFVGIVVGIIMVVLKVLGKLG